MNTELTVQVDEELVERAKAFSKVSGKSVSQIVADYLAMLPGGSGEQGTQLTPIVRSLWGILRGADVDEADYRRHLEDKYLEILRFTA